MHCQFMSGQHLHVIFLHWKHSQDLTTFLWQALSNQSNLNCSFSIIVPQPIRCWQLQFHALTLVRYGTHLQTSGLRKLLSQGNYILVVGTYNLLGPLTSFKYRRECISHVLKWHGCQLIINSTLHRKPV